MKSMQGELPRSMTLAVGGIALIAAIAYGQGDSSRAAFDAASFKLLAPEEVRAARGFSRMQGGPGTGSPGRFTYTTARLMELLTRAWGLPAYQIVVPSWVTRDREAYYTLIATMPPETTEQQFKVMLQNLLAQRLQMTFHLEERRVAGYDLLVAQGGPRLKESADPNAPDADGGLPPGLDKDGFPVLAPGHGVRIFLGDGMRAKFQNYTVSEFANGNYLRGWVAEAAGSIHGPIRDKTGLIGKYDFTLAFDNRRAANVLTGAGRTVAGDSDGVTAAMATVPSGHPNIFGAIEKQLGLKLVPVKDMPVKVLVIDKVEKMPIEN
jgi:uncharacterized protein (TIGR03435 family)